MVLKRTIIFPLFLLVLSFPGLAVKRNYINGNKFIDIADYKVEGNSCSFNPAAVAAKSIIYIETNYLEYFFNRIFPQIKNPIILLTHNGDHYVPGTFASYLEDPKIIRWFGQNCDVIHPKFHPIPIGLANPKWAHGNPDIFDEALDILEKKGSKNRIFQIYINFSVSTNPIRGYLHQFFQNKPIAFFTAVKPVRSYLLEMAQYQFVLSPHGNGLDCHRTWEALYVGSIPIVKTSTLDPLYEDLPVIIVQQWEEVTPGFLKEKYEQMKQVSYKQERLFIDYWINLIKNYKNEVTMLVGS